jgi:hypothetical protein
LQDSGFLARWEDVIVIHHSPDDIGKVSSRVSLPANRTFLTVVLSRAATSPQLHPLRSLKKEI